MTKDEILNMPASREMDAFIAHRIMMIVFPVYEFDGYQHQYSPKPYSTDIAAAWEVIEKIGERKYRQFYLCTNFSSEFGNRIYAEIFERIDENEIIECSATAETIPLAICRAALLCVTAQGQLNP